MTSAEAGQVRRGVMMVGPPYLYNGAQVCGRRASRTCVFLLASFGTAFCMIGIVFFTADLRMESGLWAAGTGFILLGVVLLVWFMTLCCAARHAFKSQPASRAVRIVPSASSLAQPRSSTYQLLPMTTTRTQVTPSYHRPPDAPMTPSRTQITHVSHLSAMQTLPSSNSQKAREAESARYPTWGHVRWNADYTTPQPRLQPAAYTWDTSPRHTGSSQGLRGYTNDCTMTEYSMPHPLTAHTLSRASPALRPGSLSSGYTMTRPPTHVSPTSYMVDEEPPPYHTVVSGP